MKLERLKKQLVKDEGKSLKVYKDHLGYLTVGIGHLIVESDPEEIRNLALGDKITEEQCNDLFMQDLAKAIADAKIVFDPVWDTFPDIVQEVVINMLFNLGRPRFFKFKKTILAIYEGRFEDAAVEMLDSKWAKQVPNRANRLSAQMERYKNYS